MGISIRKSDAVSITGCIAFSMILVGCEILPGLLGFPSESQAVFNVTYDGNGATGGTTPVDLAEYESGQSVTVLGNTGNLIRTGKVYSGWNTAAAGGGTSYQGGDTFTVGSVDVVLYAEWQSPIIGGTWVSKKPMPTARHWSASAVYNNKIYVIGGGGGFTKNEVYDPTTDTWIAKDDLLGGFFLVRAATVGDKIYMVTGSSTTNSIHEYNTATDTWTNLGNSPNHSWISELAVVGNRIYIFGGYDGSTAVSAVNDVYEYYPATDTWTAKASMPTARYAPATAVVNGKIYVFGGNYGSDKTEMYDPSTNSWTAKKDIPTSLMGWDVAGAFGTDILVAKADDSVAVLYDTVADTWHTLENGPTERGYITGEVSNGVMYVIGGEISLNDSALNEAYIPAVAPQSLSVIKALPDMATKPVLPPKEALQKHLDAFNLIESQLSGGR